MPQAPLVDANGAHIPALGLGTWPMKDAACARAVQWAVEAGYRHIDTAEMYGNEEAVGAGIRASGIARNEVWVTTKVWPENIAAGDLQQAAAASCKRLGLDSVDLLLIHWPNRAIPLADSIAALNDARRQGLARHIGISNFTSTMVAQAARLSQAPLVANECEYHPRLDQTKVLAACRAEGLAFIAYCPIGKGGSGGLLGDAAIRDIARAHGRTPAQIALRWLVQQPGVIAIPKSADRGRIAENIAIFDFALSHAEMAQISGLARRDGRIVDFQFSPDWDD